MNCRGKSSELAWATFLKFQYKTCHLLNYIGSMCTTLWLHSTAHIFFPNGIFPLVHGFRCQKTANTKEREEGADNFFSSPIGHGSFLKEWKFLTQFSKCLLWLIDSLKLFHLKKDKLLLKESKYLTYYYLNSFTSCYEKLIFYYVYMIIFSKCKVKPHLTWIYIVWFSINLHNLNFITLCKLFWHSIIFG